MKKICAFLLLLTSIPAWSAVNYSDLCINKTSFTLTNDSFVAISTLVPLSFEGICIGSATLGGTASILDGSSVPYLSTITVVNMGNAGCQLYNVEISSALSYKTTGNSNGISILYRVRRPQ